MSAASTAVPAIRSGLAHVSIRLQLLLLGALAGTVMLALTGWQAWRTYQTARDSRQTELRHLVDSSLGLLAWAQAQEAKGLLTRAQAQQLAVSAIQAQRYGGNEYYWINDMTPRVVMHPIKPALNGQDVSGVKDPEGNALFVRFVETVRRDGAGYVRYLWPKPGHEQAVEKVSYVAGFQPWGWVLGTGMYMDDLRAEFMQGMRWLVLELGLALGAVVMALHRVHRHITQGLARAGALARTIASGDVSQRIEVHGSNEISALEREMQRMSEQLNLTVGAVQASAMALAQASEEIAQANQDLSARTERTAGHLQQAAASLGEVTRSVQGNANAAEQARQDATAASAVAAEGGQRVDQAVRTMADIHQAAQRIGAILGTIDGIAFQTNILALNAAVEAARAGESGRGFAVVATEVRLLAQRSADAAREIKGLIQNALDRTAAGTQLVEAAGSTMAKLVSSVRDVDALIGNISAASRQQSEGLAQVNHSVGDLDGMTQHNAALVEQSAASAESLRDQAERLTHAVRRFKLASAA